MKMRDFIKVTGAEGSQLSIAPRQIKYWIYSPTTGNTTIYFGDGNTVVIEGELLETQLYEVYDKLKSGHVINCRPGEDQEKTRPAGFNNPKRL